MSKAVLVIDMPTQCIDCPAHFVDEPVYWCGVTDEVLLSDCIETFKPDWCPLKEMPQRMASEPDDSEYVSGGKNGWNFCIHRILGNSL